MCRDLTFYWGECPVWTHLNCYSANLNSWWMHASNAGHLREPHYPCDCDSVLGVQLIVPCTGGTLCPDLVSCSRGISPILVKNNETDGPSHSADRRKLSHNHYLYKQIIQEQDWTHFTIEWQHSDGRAEGGCSSGGLPRLTRQVKLR